MSASRGGAALLLVSALGAAFASSTGYPFSIVSDASWVWWVEQRAPGDAYNGRPHRSTGRVSRDPDRVQPLAGDHTRTAFMMVK
jgi:hypothetical protein